MQNQLYQNRTARMSQKVQTNSFPDKPFKPYPTSSMTPLDAPHHQNHKKNYNNHDLQVDQITKDFQNVLFDNTRWSEPMYPPNQLPKNILKGSMTPVDLNDDDQFLVINSDKKKSMDMMIQAQDIQKLKQRVRQLTINNDKLKQQNLQLRLQKMKLASNSQAMQLLQLKMEMQETNKRIAILQKQKQEAMKKAGLSNNDEGFQNRNLTSNSRSDCNLLGDLAKKNSQTEIQQFHTLNRPNQYNFQFYYQGNQRI